MSREKQTTRTGLCVWVDAVMDGYVMAGQIDHLLRVLAQSLKDHERFVRAEQHAIPGIEQWVRVLCMGG